MKLNVVTVVKYYPAGTDLREYLEDYKTKSLDPISKYGWGIASLIADLYNYTMHIDPVEEWLTEVNGTEQGMMAKLDRAESDFGISPSSAILRYAAKPYAHMLTPGYPYRSFFIFRSNEVETLKWMELMTPFAFGSWYAIVLTAVFSIMIITTIQVTEYQEGWFPEIGHAIFATLGVLCQQGLTFVPNRIAGRIAFLFLLFFGVLLSNYYGASVVSARLNEPQDKMNDSLYSLAKSHMTVTSEPFRYIDFNLVYRATWEWEVRYFLDNVWLKQPETKWVKPEEGLKNVALGGYAYHTSPEVAYPYVEANWDDKAICDMTEVHVVDPRILVFWERVDSPFTELTKIGLIQTAITGLRQRTIKRWKPKTPYCSPDARSLESITIFDIAPAVMIVIIGNVLAGTICFFECVMYRLHPNDTAGQTKKKKPRLGGKKALIRIKKNNEMNLQ
nr:ionotropic receptor 75a [Gregopimpla kuwanae]